MNLEILENYIKQVLLVLIVEFDLLIRDRDMGTVLSKALDTSGDSDAICLARAAQIVVICLTYCSRLKVHLHQIARRNRFQQH